ncbi:hypothetical protein [Herbidospora daliensis]|uniref:hypothetical protein n=1 Tax=Herbidospora daliensis TaxID=295585 RepID=UPI000A98DE81|nr:hypothetical protein [Herbidospora daliensis]
MDPLREHGTDLASLHDHALAALGEAENDRSPSTLRAALELTEELLESSSDDAEAHYLRGFALYLSWTTGFALRREAMAEFRHTLDRDPGHPWARFHVIELCYSAGMHEEAIGHFGGMSESWFAERDLVWRYLLAWEYAVAAKIALRRFDEVWDELPRLVDRYVELEDSDDILEAPARLLAQWRRLPPDHEFGEYLAGQLRRFVPGGWLKPDDLIVVPDRTGLSHAFLPAAQVSGDAVLPGHSTLHQPAQQQRHQ